MGLDKPCTAFIVISWTAYLYIHVAFLNKDAIRSKAVKHNSVFFCMRQTNLEKSEKGLVDLDVVCKKLLTSTLVLLVWVKSTYNQNKSQW